MPTANLHSPRQPEINLDPEEKHTSFKLSTFKHRKQRAPRKTAETARPRSALCATPSASSPLQAPMNKAARYHVRVAASWGVIKIRLVLLASFFQAASLTIYSRTFALYVKR